MAVYTKLSEEELKEFFSKYNLGKLLNYKEIKEGMECGIGIEGAGKFKEDDIIVTFEIQSIKRTLEL